ncbi:MAG: hypothetical protein AB1728_00290 [Bacteroidota bacterium]
MMKSTRHTLLTLAALLAVINLQCSLEDSSVIEPTVETLTVSSITITPDSVNTDSIFVNGAQTPNDNISLATNVFVKANRNRNQISLSTSIKVFQNNSSIGFASLNDEGIFPDVIGGDSIYSGSVDFSVKRSYYGKLIVSVEGGNSQATSPTITTFYTVTRNNRNPVIDSVQVPDTLTLGTTPQTVEIFAYVRDEDGTADIAQVFFNAYLLPDTVNPRGLPIRLFDDGGKDNTAGNGNTDRIPGDGKYSVTLFLPPDVPKGTRRFVFEAIDLANTKSLPVKHDIVIQ